MRSSTRIDGIEALVTSSTFAVGIAMVVTLMADDATGDPHAAGSVTSLVDHRFQFHVRNVDILFGIVMVPVVLAPHAWLSDRRSSPMPMATCCGPIRSGLVIATGTIADIGLGTVVERHENEPARAETVRSTLDAARNGLGGGNEIVGDDESAVRETS